jgi:hypothetical protein
VRRLCGSPVNAIAARAFMVLSSLCERGKGHYGLSAHVLRGLAVMDSRVVTATLCACETADLEFDLSPVLAEVLDRALSGRLPGNQVLCSALRVVALRGIGSEMMDSLMVKCLYRSAGSVVFEAICTVMVTRCESLHLAALDAARRVFGSDRYMRIRCWLVIAKVRPALVREHVPQMLEDAEALEDSNWFAVELLTLLQSDGADPRIASFLESSVTVQASNSSKPY